MLFRSVPTSVSSFSWQGDCSLPQIIVYNDHSMSSKIFVVWMLGFEFIYFVFPIPVALSWARTNIQQQTAH